MIFKINSASTLMRFPRFLINPYTVNLGYIPDETVPSGQDEMFYSSPMSTQAMMGEVSLKRYFKDVSDQYHLSSCVANAVADAFEAQQAQKLGVSPDKVDDLSRLFIYWNARNLSNPPIADRDKGCQIRWAFDSVKRYGVPSEQYFPYSTTKVNTKPNWLVFKKAIQNKIRNFYRVSGTGDSRIVQIKQALAAGAPVVFGTKIYEPFRHVTDLSVIKVNSSDKYIGRHAMVITGWSDSKQAFEVRNSWGLGFGENGYCMMDVNYIKSSITQDLWAATV